MFSRLSLLFLLLLVPACGGDDDDTGADGDADADTDADADADADGDADACVTDAAQVDLTGVWAVQATSQADLTERPAALVHLCPDGHALASATIYLRLEVTQAEDGSLSQDVSFCSIQLPIAPGSIAECDNNPQEVPIAIGLGDGLAQLLPTIVTPGAATLAIEDGCATYRPDPVPLVLGTTFNPTDEVTPLPAWDQDCADNGTAEDCVADLASVVDQDGDGNPGVTLTADSEAIAGEAYVTFRTVPTLIGTLRDDHTMVGTLADPIEYGIIGSDIHLGGGLSLSTTQVVQNLPSVTPLEEGNVFVALRADDWGGATCTDILAHTNDFN